MNLIGIINSITIFYDTYKIHDFFDLPIFAETNVNLNLNIYKHTGIF